MALPYDPNFRMAIQIGEIKIDRDLEHDSSVSAAIVAVDLISSTRLAHKLDSAYTEYSAQYLVDNALPKRKNRQGGTDLKLTVKDCLEFALKKGIPKAEDWPHLGSVSKPPSSYKPALVSMKGDVIEAKTTNEAWHLSKDQPVAAKLHVFSPQIDLVGEVLLLGVYCGPSGEDSGYVGLRDCIIVQEDKLMGKAIATVKVWYKNRFKFVKVALSRMFQQAFANADDPRNIAPTTLLVDYCVLRLSIN